MASSPKTVAPKRSQKAASSSQEPVNLNHLLNFSLPPRQTGHFNSIPRRSRKTANVHGIWNKERFVNAQYRFVMNPNGDYTVHFADPDIFFQWQDILQIIVPRVSRAAVADDAATDIEGLSTCPICLSPPTAPRMTKCGHVFCFPCILHYLSTSENKWARCPICFDSVNASQLKNVKWYEGPSATALPGDPSTSSASSLSNSEPILETTPRPGSSLRMRLIQRPQITTLALPRSQTWPSGLLPPHQAPFYFLPDVYNFAKFMLATPDYVIADLTNELDQLAEEKKAMGATKDDLSLYFITGAEEKIRQQMEKAAALESSFLKEKIDKAVRDQKEILENVERRTRVQPVPAPVPVQAQAPTPEPVVDIGEVPTEFLALKSPVTTTSTPTPTNIRPPNNEPTRAINAHGRANTPRQRRNINPPPPSTSTYYYYQAASGLPVYLHPLDIKILLSHFRSYYSFPNEITIQVEASTESTVDDDLRKRCKYLAHLPESADVIFVEADLESVVGAEGLKNFEGPLKTRSTRRKEKARKDDKAKARAEEREREKEREALARFMPRSTRSPLAVEHVFPQPSAESGGASGSPREGEEARGSEVQSNASTSPPVPSGAWGNRSFASALHSSGAGRSGNPARRRELTEEEWDAEVMWQELEQRTMNNATGGGGGGKKKKKGTKMVVLGGGGSGARRR